MALNLVWYGKNVMPLILRRLSPSILLIFVLISMALPVHADDTDKANRLFVAAVKAWNAAAATSGETIEAFDTRVRLLQEVAQNLDAIVEKYPGADLAVQLIIGEKIGPLSLADAAVALGLQKVGLEQAKDTLEQAKRLALCQVQPDVGCVLEEAFATARGIENASFRAGTLASIAEAQAKAGLIEEALVTARGIEDDFYRVVSLASIAVLLPVRAE